MRELLIGLAGVLAIAMLTIGVWHLFSRKGVEREQNIPTTFFGRILAASDADMYAYGYANGLTNKVVGIEDTLSLVDFSGGRARIVSRKFASNSVISWPAILAWHPSLRFAYVAETRGVIAADPVAPMGDVFTDFPEGTKISVFDYSDPVSPRLVQDTAIGRNLQAVSLNKMGDLLASSSTAAGAELLFARLDSGRIGDVFTFTEDQIDNDLKDAGFRNVEFHPTDNVVAVNLNGNSVAFYRVVPRGTGLAAVRIGEPVYVGQKLSVGNWHPSGDYFLVSEVNWGDGPLGAVTNRAGALISIAFRPNGQAVIASRAKTGLSPEGFDVSPDGKYAIAVNMGRTYLPAGLRIVPERKRASLSLIGIDATNGRLTVLGNTYGFRGALPEDAIFDAESNSIAVAVYHGQDEDFPTKGWLDFWEIRNDRLIKTNTHLPLARGVHNLLLIPKSNP